MTKAPASTVPGYHRAHTGAVRAVLEVLRDEICSVLPEAESKVWHGHPVWFLEGNPVVGYSVLKSAAAVVLEWPVVRRTGPHGRGQLQGG